MTWYEWGLLIWAGLVMLAGDDYTGNHPPWMVFLAWICWPMVLAGIVLVLAAHVCLWVLGHLWDWVYSED